MNKRPDITDATKQRFIDAFCKLYKTKPIEKITVKEISEIAGHNRVTFYQYFKDSYDVLETIEKSLLKSIQNAVEYNIQNPDMFEDFEKIFDKILEDNTELVELLLAGANYSNTLERCKNAMLPVLVKSFRLDESDYKMRAILEFYLSGIVSLLKYKIDYNEKITTTELGMIIKYILQNGILPQLTNRR